ncbi:MAG: hypothetical protein HY092_00440 [Candidatus Kerfeldbacteria bacterium]|nr:hypothetical protein [Candidatus Kerfeldbacteria bacterium]
MVYGCGASYEKQYEKQQEALCVAQDTIVVELMDGTRHTFPPEAKHRYHMVVENTTESEASGFAKGTNTSWLFISRAMASGQDEGVVLAVPSSQVRSFIRKPKLP